MNEENIVWRWTPDPAQGLADEYVIEKNPDAEHGIIVFYKYRGVWYANPLSTRPVIAELLREIDIHP